MDGPTDREFVQQDDSTLKDQIRDFDGRERAFVASIIKEIDVIGQLSSSHEPLGGAP